MKIAIQKIHLNKLIIILSIAFLIPQPARIYGQNNQDSEAIVKKVEEYIKKVQSDWKIPGLSVSISKDGRMVYTGGFGVKELTNNMFSDRENAVDQNTVFQIGSISKSFTAA